MKRKEIENVEFKLSVSDTENKQLRKELDEINDMNRERERELEKLNDDHTEVGYKGIIL